MNQIEAAFYFGDFRQIYADAQKIDIEKVVDTRYNVSFSDRKNKDLEVKKF